MDANFETAKMCYKVRGWKLLYTVILVFKIVIFSLVFSAKNIFKRFWISVKFCVFYSTFVLLNNYSRSSKRDKVVRDKYSVPELASKLTKFSFFILYSCFQIQVTSSFVDFLLGNCSTDAKQSFQYIYERSWGRGGGGHEDWFRVGRI